MSSADVRATLQLAIDELASNPENHKETERFYRGKGPGLHVYVPTPDLPGDGLVFTITVDTVDMEQRRTLHMVKDASTGQGG